MADNAEAGSDAQVTFKVKTSSDGAHTITMAESATVLDLKTTLAGESYENIPVERQRLIYSGRVMKNDDTLATYKIKPNNTIHMVKSAASNPSQAPAAASAPTPQNVPTNMASGTANNPLAGLTGARYAGHQVNLPGMDMFGPDGGMGPPMDEERLSRMMSDPNVQQSMTEALNNPDFVNMLIESNPMLRNMPNAREIITSPFMRQMMGNPQMLSQAMRMQRNMRGGEGAFPAPGATDTTPDGAQAAGEGGANAGQQNPMNPFMNPFMGMGGGAGGNGGMNLAELLQGMGGAGGGFNPFAPQGAAAGQTQTGAGATTNTSTTENQGSTENRGDAGAQGNTNTEGAGSPQNAQGNAAANPFAALFPGTGGAQPGNPFGVSPEQMMQMMQMLGGGAGAGAGAGGSPAPPDNRPPEERYAEQLRQLNDMGFFDFDRNVAALRRSGGSVQGAIEHLLGAMD